MLYHADRIDRRCAGPVGVAAVASQISWVLFLVGIILLVVHLTTGRVSGMAEGPLDLTSPKARPPRR